MSAGEKFYILFVLATFGVYAVALAYQSWQWSRMSERRAVQAKSIQADTRLAPASVHA